MSEADNHYVSSRGLLKSCDYHSSTPFSSIRQMTNYPTFELLKALATKNTNGTQDKIPSIYICSSAIPHFIHTLLPHINFKFILVSGDCDESIPNDILNPEFFNKFASDERIVHWFCQNLTVSHQKITRMPIAFDYHTMTQRQIWGPISSCADQERILGAIVDKVLPFWERKTLIYSNFHFSMNTKHSYDRHNALTNIKTDLIDYEENHINRMATWNKQREYAFVASPHGGGLDCHRTWEALALGCIVIVKTSTIDDLYKDLPVLIVNDWANINQELLDSTIHIFKDKHINKEFNYKKLTLNYWKDLIASYAT